VFGYADGEISGRFRESTESIEVLLVDKKEAARILKEERVSLRAAFLLMSFLRMDGAEPFAFLEE
jgi:ADP-ribose pyrophosphatase